MKEHKKFIVETIGLDGSKLIEASAGTGKTFSIALLALRLVLEKDVPVDKILMVTFTKSAAAELESRIRKFIRLAYKYAKGSDIKETKIKETVGDRNEGKKLRLKKAVSSLDNLSVMTIHSFCQKTINEFTFETNQSFSFEIVKDDNYLYEQLVNIFRREVVNTIEDFYWFREINEYLRFGKMPDILRKSISGGKFIDIDTDDDTDLNDELRRLIEATSALKEKVRDNFDIIKKTKIRKNARLAKHMESPEQFFPVFIQDCCIAEKYIDEFAFLYEPDGREIGKLSQRVKKAFYSVFINSSMSAIKKTKLEKGIISFDDQIRTIYEALNNEDFTGKLAGKYRAVFIDEFQDTDMHQYKIFKKVFSEGDDSKADKPVIFYIGDPKQSIYAWRGADLDTYKEAKRDVGEDVFTMDKNFRATGDMVNALNILLDPDKQFNMFDDDEIWYNKVKQGAADLGEMSENRDKVKPVTIWKFDRDDAKTNYRIVAEEVFRLLTGDVIIKGEKIKPGDIGILVRENTEGDAIKSELNKFNIPSVKRDNAKVLQSKESGMIKNLIEAVLSPARGGICRALNYSYAGFNSLSLKTLDDIKHIEVFLGLRKTLREDGIYNMIASFLDIYDIRDRCMKDVSGQRVLANITHIAELLHAAEKRHKLAPSELIVWLDRSRENNEDDFEQRIESDEDAVQISTIHKAKGLEYKIVFAPCLSMVPKTFFLQRGQINEFRKGDECLFTLNFPDLGEDDRILHSRQKEQENRRLVYVALTRAVYKCYISLVPKNDGKNSIESSLSVLLDRYTGNSELIEIIDRSENDITRDERKYVHKEGLDKFWSRPVPEELVVKNTFGIHSYSALSKGHHAAPFEKTDIEGDGRRYDRFIFQDLGRGANVGTALHSIFERLDFSNESTWNMTIQDASKYYSNIIHGKNEEKNIESNLGYFRQLVDHVMRADININDESFSLSEITSGKRLPELEFLFTVEKVNRAEVNKYLGEDARLGGDSNIEGLMTGFIDLLFEHKGKYYILDWKSNHLGNGPEFYDREGMEQAMTGSNYHLQYMIYTVAAVRWLKTRIPDFDYDRCFGGVIYLFLRGIRQGMNTGIYTARPEKGTIEDLDKALRGKLQEADN